MQAIDTGTRRITFNGLFSESISSDNDDDMSIPSSNSYSSTDDLSTDFLKVAPVEATNSNHAIKYQSEILSDLKSSSKKAKKQSGILKPSSRATTARAETAGKIRDFPIRLKFPLKKVNISRPHTANAKFRFPDIEEAISRPESAIKSRPETAYNISDWESRPPTGRLKEKDRLVVVPISRFLPLPDHSKKAVMKRLFSAQKDIEYDSNRIRTNSVAPLAGRLLQVDLNDAKVDRLININIPLEAYFDAISDYEQEESKVSPKDSIGDDIIVDFLPVKSKISPSFIIIHGQINQDSLVFKRFLQESLSIGISVSLLQCFLVKLQKFAFDYNLTYAECSFKKIHGFLLSSAISWRLINREVLVDIMENKSSVEAQVKTPGRVFKGGKSRFIAATKIQSTYRMVRQKRVFDFFKFQKKCAATIISYFRNRIKRRNRILAQSKILDTASSAVQELTAKFQEEWESSYLLNPEGRTTILINSMTFSPKYRSKVKSMSEKQKNNYGRLVQLLDDNISAVFVTPEMSLAEKQYLKTIISLHWDYLELLRTKRLKIVEVFRPAFFYTDAALSTILLMSPSIIKSISNHIMNKKAYVESLIASKEDCRFCELLNIPLYGNPNMSTEFAHNRLKQRRFAMESGAKVPPGFVFPPKSLSMGVIKVFSDLTNGNPDIERWIMKMNDLGDGEGLAYFTVPPSIKRPVKFIQDDISNNVQYVSSFWKGQWKDFLKAFVTKGGLIEACAGTKTRLLHVVSLHMDITPDLRLIYSGSNSMIPGALPLTVAGCIMPHNFKDKKTIQAEATLIGQSLLAKKYIGPITIDLICWEEKYVTTAWITSIKLFYTTTRDRFNLSKLAARDGNLDSGIIHQPPPEAFPNFTNLKRLKYFDVSNHFRTYTKNPVKSPRVSMYLSGLTNSGSKNFSKEAFYWLIVQSNATLSKEGVGALALISDTDEVSFFVIQNDLKKCAQKVLSCLLLLKKRIKSNDETDNFLDVAISAFKLLSPTINEGIIQYSSLEDFGQAHNDGLVVTETPIFRESSTVPGVSADTIKLLAADVPSRSLHLFDPDYGKTKTVRIVLDPNRIVPGTHTVEQYLELMEKSAEGALGVRKLGNTQMASRMQSFFLSKK